jgi:hypothetical protein
MPKVAEELMAYCTKCRLDLMHVIVSMDGQAIAKTQCKSCGGVHMYRPPKNSENSNSSAKLRRTRKRTETGKGNSGKPAAESSSRWKELVSGVDSNELRGYRMQEYFEEGELISHKAFGAGVVIGVRGPEKIEVLFEEGIKLLAQGR